MATNGLQPSATLQTVDFLKLAERQQSEIDRLFDIAVNDGFMYLDLTRWNSGQLLASLDKCNELTKDWFKRPIEEKLTTETPSDAHGYKRVGQQSGVKEGERDGYESLRLARTAQLSRKPLPQIVQENLDVFDDLHYGSHHVLKTILLSLSSKLFGEENSQMSQNHDDARRSRSALYFLHHPPKPAGAGLGQNIHTDAGTLTLLFTQQMGLQVLSPTTGAWEYVETRKGHGIVNVGDTLRFLSGERFRSALHRVLPITDEHGAQPHDRYSTAYFLRAADDAIFVGHDGNATTAEEWFLKKFHSFTQDRSTQRLDSVAFGGMEKALSVTV